MAPRLTTEFWIAAYRARLTGAGIFAHIAYKGDPTAGAVAIKVATMDRNASLYMRRYDENGDLVWSAIHEGVPESDVDTVIARQRGYDRDLWVVEIEDPKGRNLLDEEGLG